MKKLFTAFTVIVLFSGIAFPQSWTVQQSNTTQGLWSVVFTSNATGFACGTGGTILKTTNSGTNWVSKPSGTTHDLMFLQFINSNTGMCASLQGPLLRTTNAGETWSAFAFGSLPATHVLGGGWFTDINTGVVGYGFNSYNQSRILRTTNGGSTWDTVYTPSPLIQGWLSYMHFPDALNGYATVAYGTVYKTTNGGVTWTSLSIPGATSQLWTSGVYFFNAQTGFVGGGSYSTMTGQIFKTTNGGSNWQLITDQYGIAKIQFADNTYGYGLAANNTAGNGLLIRTVDGGNNWSIFTTPMDSLNGMHFLNSTLGYAVGVRGRILRYGFPIGIRIISGNVPEKFTLHQNYPNPFNPSTTIRYELPKNDYVKLVVYDALGHEIETLVNEKQSEGIYEVTWDASNISSGVYFYTLKTSNNFAAVRKMIVMK